MFSVDLSYVVVNYIKVYGLPAFIESSESETCSPLAHNQAMSISFPLGRLSEDCLSEASSAALAKGKDIWACARGLHVSD